VLLCIERCNDPEVRQPLLIRGTANSKCACCNDQKADQDTRAHDASFSRNR
jgi:hypothetical protein